MKRIILYLVMAGVIFDSFVTWSFQKGDHSPFVKSFVLSYEVCSYDISAILTATAGGIIRAAGLIVALIVAYVIKEFFGCVVRVRGGIYCRENNGIYM